VVRWVGITQKTGFSLAALACTLADSRMASRVDAAWLTVAFTMLLTTVAIYSLCRSVPVPV
jgi:hypothetical protein